jgi:hypothetical protein
VLSTIEAGLAKIGSNAWIRKERTFDLDRDRAIKGLFIELVDRAKIGSTGIDEQDVEVAESGLHRLGNHFLSGDIAGIGLDDQSLVAELGVGLLDGHRVGAGDCDAGTFGDELAGCFKADAAGAAGDERSFILQT